MNQHDVDGSPLKLYQTAYTLHYKEHKIAEACEIYEQIIRQFPDSDVSAYASIQLQKIHADEITRRMARRWVPALPLVILLAANVLLVAVLATLLAVNAHRVEAQKQKTGELIRALGKMYSGRDDDALDILRHVKIGYRNDITPFALSSEIYRKNDDYMRARKEFETYRRLYPKDPLPELEIAEINQEEDEHIKGALEAKSGSAPIPEDVVKEEDRKAAVRAGTGSSSTAARPAKKRPKLLVPVDSIHYF